MDYNIIINLNSERINDKDYYFWYISNNSSDFASNCGHGWASTILEAAKNAETYYNEITKMN